MTKQLTDSLASAMLTECSLGEYHAAIARGALTEDDRVELLYGKLSAYMPSGGPHAETVDDTAECLRSRLGSAYKYREEKPVTFAFAESEPEPDVAVVTKKRYAPSHPTAKDIYLLVEVAQDSLRKDRTVKATLYAQAGVPEYWIIDLVDRQVYLHTQPDTETATYGSVVTYATGQHFASPLVGPVAVDELLL